LAAGAGNRLGNGSPKCLTDVSGTPILGRLIASLVENGFKRLVVIVGYRGQQIKDYLDRNSAGLDIRYIESRQYESTNNIYSLWLARNYMREPFLLIESDLVFDSRLLASMRTSDRIAVAKFRSHMHGTTVSVDTSGMVASFRVGGLDGPRLPNKTINIYSLSMSTWHEVTRRLELRIAAGRVHDYYEAVFGEMAGQGVLPMRAVWFDDGRWSEIDTPEDLLAARELFYEPGLAKGA
jgi:choline kinase